MVENSKTTTIETPRNSQFHRARTYIKRFQLLFFANTSLYLKVLKQSFFYTLTFVMLHDLRNMNYNKRNVINDTYQIN